MENERMEGEMKWKSANTKWKIKNRETERKEKWNVLKKCEHCKRKMKE